MPHSHRRMRTERGATSRRRRRARRGRSAGGRRDRGGLARGGRRLDEEPYERRQLLPPESTWDRQDEDLQVVAGAAWRARDAFGTVAPARQRHVPHLGPGG